MLDNIKILLIVPAYNEEKSLSNTLEEILSICKQVDILVVNDASEDNTDIIAKRYGCKLITLSHNLGIGGAVQTGFIFAYLNNYDIVVQVDADGQHSAKYLNDLIRPIINDSADIVIGSRYLQKSGYTSTFMRNIGIRLFSLITTIIIKQRISDVTSGFRAYSKKCFKYLSNYYPVDFPDAEAIIDFHNNNFRIIEISIEMKRRYQGKSSTSFVKSFYYPFRMIISIVASLLKKIDIP